MTTSLRHKQPLSFQTIKKEQKLQYEFPGQLSRLGYMLLIRTQQQSIGQGRSNFSSSTNFRRQSEEKQSYMLFLYLEKVFINIEQNKKILNTGLKYSENNYL